MQSPLKIRRQFFVLSGRQLQPKHLQTMDFTGVSRLKHSNIPNTHDGPLAAACFLPAIFLKLTSRQMTDFSLKKSFFV